MIVLTKLHSEKTADVWSTTNAPVAIQSTHRIAEQFTVSDPNVEARAFGEGGLTEPRKLDDDEGRERAASEEVDEEPWRCSALAA